MNISDGSPIEPDQINDRLLLGNTVRTTANAQFPPRNRRRTDLPRNPVTGTPKPIDGAPGCDSLPIDHGGSETQRSTVGGDLLLDDQLLHETHAEGVVEHLLPTDHVRCETQAPTVGGDLVGRGTRSTLRCLLAFLIPLRPKQSQHPISHCEVRDRPTPPPCPLGASTGIFDWQLDGDYADTPAAL